MELTFRGLELVLQFIKTPIYKVKKILLMYIQRIIVKLGYEGRVFYRMHFF